MNEEPLESPTSAREPVDYDEESPEKETVQGERDTDTQSTQEPVEPIKPDFKVKPSMDLQDVVQDIKTEGNLLGDAPLDWLEPLEEDDDVENLRNDHDEESVAGESERSESLAGSENAYKRNYNRFRVQRRPRSDPNDGWVDWPALGKGWKRKEVVRRSGSSVGQKDVYYMSPRGDRVRSRVELLTVVEDVSKIENFHYKTGTFCDSDTPPMRIRRKRKVRERSSSESSWMERGEGADTPDSSHRLTPSKASKRLQNNQTALVAHNDRDDDSRLNILPDTSSSIQWSLNNGTVKSHETLLCSKCGSSYYGTWYDKKRKRPVCPTCWGASKSTEHPWYRFRKWIPCGQCSGCRNSVDCNNCVNCKHGVTNSKTRKRICYYRKCLYPIRKNSASDPPQLPEPCSDSLQTLNDSTGLPDVKDEVTDSQHASLKSSDTENVSVIVDADADDDDDMSTDDDDDWHKKRKRRACGQCQACQCRRDCGTCDFCVDKPKFGGSNKKRQKCRLRQCQRQAMRHLLPFQMAQSELAAEDAQLLGRPKPQYTYSRKSGLKRKKRLSSGVDLSDNEHDFQEQLNQSDYGQRNGLSEKDASISNHNTSGDQFRRRNAEKSRLGKSSHIRDYDDSEEPEEDEEEEEMEIPTISQIFSLADQAPERCLDVENELMKLLESLRLTAMPFLWYAIMVDGPQLHLIQCSKLSSMADTIVVIDPGFHYHVTVQRQPLLPTHPLYAKFPGRLTSVTNVVDLLLALEKYVLCQGLPPPEQFLNKSPLILERASTCEFLINKNLRSCQSCLSLQGY